MGQHGLDREVRGERLREGPRMRAGAGSDLLAVVPRRPDEEPPIAEEVEDADEGRADEASVALERLSESAGAHRPPSSTTV